MFNLFQLADNDQSIFYLGQIFGNVGSVLAGTGSDLMVTMFKTFNTAVLVLGGILVTYVTVVGLMNTAHEGEFLGKKFHSTWTPVKMVMGIAGLVPTSKGYCALQIVIMWLIVQGVAAGDTIWKSIIDYLGAGSPITAAPAPKFNDIGDYIPTTTSQLFGSLVCQSLVTKVAQNSEDAISPITACGNGNPSQGQNIHPTDCENPANPLLYAFGRARTAADSNFDPIDECGYVAWATDRPALNNLDAQHKALQSDMQIMLPAIASVADYYVKSIIDDSNCWQDIGCTDSTKPCYFGKYNSLVMANIGGQCIANNPDQAWANILTQSGTNFVKLMTLHLAGSAGSYASQSATPGNASPVNINTGTTISSSLNSDYQKAEANGWIMAGAFYYYISKQNNKTTDHFLEYLTALKSSINQYPTVKQPPVDKSYPDHKNYTDFSTTKGYDDAVQTVYASAAPIVKQGLSAFQTAANIGGGLQVAAGQGGPSGPDGTLASSANNVMSHFMDMLAPHDSTANPLVTIQNFGWSLIQGGEVIYGVGLGLVVLLGVGQTYLDVLGTTVNPLAGTAAGILSYLLPVAFFLMAYMFAAGIYLGIYMPLIPYTLFTFSTIGWFMACIEAMVAGPIIAIGILSPAGQHEILGRADPATMILMNIFLRPTLMIIGMFAGMLLSYVVIELINAGFSGVVNTLMPSSGMGLVEMCLIVVAYGTLIAAALNKCFALVYMLPNQVLRWIGGREENYGEAQSLGEVHQGINAGGQAIGSGASGTGQRASGSAQGMQNSEAKGRGAAKQEAAKEKRAADARAAERAPAVSNTDSGASASAPAASGGASASSSTPAASSGSGNASGAEQSQN